MSGPTPHNDQHGHAASDEIAYGKVIVIGVVSLAIFALATVWAAVILSRETKKNEQATGAIHRPLRVEKEEIGIVDQVPFAVDTRLKRWRAAHTGRLNGYGWIDRSKGIAHVPIESAIEAVAGGALPAGAPTGTAPTGAAGTPAATPAEAPAGTPAAPPAAPAGAPR
jgi:hypothetical protein